MISRQQKNMYYWIKANKDLWLTLEDFDEWPTGQTYEVAMFDRNFEEMGSIWGKESKWVENKYYRPKDLFSGIRTRVTKLSGYKWRLEIDGETTEHNLEANITSLRARYCRPRPLRGISGKVTSLPLLKFFKNSLSS